MRMPEHLVQRARDIVYGDGDWTPPPARPASTVVLLRDAGHLQVALLQRASTLAFAKDMYVFPGGAVDDSDADLGDPWLVAGIRETFEEVGVLLSRPAAHPEVWRERERDFGQVLADAGLRPDLDALHPFAHWVTPEVESRRFDTRFYAAAMPAGQALGAFTSEHQNIGWYRPADAGELPMLPPTAAVLAELAQFRTVAEVLAVSRTPVPIMPHPVARDAGIGWVLINAQTRQPL